MEYMTDADTKIKKTYIRFYSKHKKIIWLLLSGFVIYDFYAGWGQYCSAKSGSMDNYLVFNRLCNYYFRKNQTSNENGSKNPEKKYIRNWKTFFPGKSSYFPYLWHDKAYVILAPASINAIRKILYQRKASYLLFDLSAADKNIQEDASTIIIAEPYPQNGRRMVFTVKDLNSGIGSSLSEKDFQKQLKKQKWIPHVESPAANMTVPDWEGAFRYDLGIIDSLLNNKTPR